MLHVAALFRNAHGQLANLTLEPILTLREKGEMPRVEGQNSLI